MTDSSQHPSPQSFEEIDDHVLKTIAESLGKKPIDLRPEQRLVEDLNLDSVDRLSLLMVLEREFDTEIPDEVLTTFVRVADVLSYVRARRAGG